VTDEALMEDLKAGSEPALQALHQRYAPMIFALAARSLGPASADDIVQDVLLAVWTSRATYQPERGRVRPWLLEITHTRILNELRRRHRHPADPALPLEDFAAADEDAPEAAAWHAQRQTVLNAALAELPAAERQALRLAFFEDLSHSEVAEFLKTPLGTVKTRIRSGVGRLLRRLTPILGPTLVVLALGAGVLLRYRADLARHDRAVRMLSLSDSETIRMGVVAGVPAETHGTFRWHPGVSTAVVTLSHAPSLAPDTHYWAWVDVDGHWVPLCELVPDATGRAVAIAETPTLGQAPLRLLVTEEHELGREPSGREIVRWPVPETH
jgi:RNA polymerase sigma-70 factor (ECF subfamily)